MEPLGSYHHPTPCTHTHIQGYVLKKGPRDPLVSRLWRPFCLCFHRRHNKGVEEGYGAMPVLSIFSTRTHPAWLSSVPSRKSGEVCCKTGSLMPLCHHCLSCPHAAVVRGAVPISFWFFSCRAHGVIVLSCPVKVGMAVGPDLAEDLCTEVEYASSWWRL